jgi:predicted MFS family arabinose efflux permease
MLIYKEIRMLKWWSGFNREYKLLLMVWLFFGLTSGLYDPTFNNYLNEVFHISAKVRGYLEFPREFPGFLVAIISGVLIFLADVHLLGGALTLVAVGLIGQSFSVWHGQPHFNWVIYSMLIWSVGTHLYLPLSSSVSIKLSNPAEIGKSLGRLNGINTVAYIAGCGLILIATTWFKIRFDIIFWAAAFFSILAAACLFFMKVKHLPEQNGPKFRLIFRKEYSLFYWLNVLFGARKQVFLTFAPWVLIQIYRQSEGTFAVLLIIASVIGIFFKPWLGKMIDRIGERRILMAEAISLIFVCLGYGFAGHLGLGSYAIDLVFLCYILDQLLFAVSMARSTYLHKNLMVESDLTPTLAMGVSMDHLVSMTVPVLGGLLWVAYGFETIFVVAALVACINLYVASKVKDQQVIQSVI